MNKDPVSIISIHSLSFLCCFPPIELFSSQSTFLLIMFPLWIKFYLLNFSSTSNIYIAFLHRKFFKTFFIISHTINVFIVSLQCEPGLGASVMYNLLYNKPQKLMLLAGCSTVCTTVAEAAKMWNLIVVSESNADYF